KLFEFRGPRRGEVIVFIKPCEPEKDFIKRVVATAGETVEVRCNVLYVNGEPVPSELQPGPCAYEARDEGETRWRVKKRSHYLETIEGKTHDTYHDPDRAARDARLRTQTFTNREPVEFWDYPRLDNTSMYVCGGNVDPHTGSPLLAPNQKTSHIVRTKEQAG